MHSSGWVQQGRGRQKKGPRTHAAAVGLSATEEDANRAMEELLLVRFPAAAAAAAARTVDLHLCFALVMVVVITAKHKRCFRANLCAELNMEELDMYAIMIKVQECFDKYAVFPPCVCFGRSCRRSQEQPRSPWSA